MSSQYVQHTTDINTLVPHTFACYLETNTSRQNNAPLCFIAINQPSEHAVWKEINRVGRNTIINLWERETNQDRDDSLRIHIVQINRNKKCNNQTHTHITTQYLDTPHNTYCYELDFYKVQTNESFTYYVQTTAPFTGSQEQQKKAAWAFIQGTHHVYQLPEQFTENTLNYVQFINGTTYTHDCGEELKSYQVLTDAYQTYDTPPMSDIRMPVCVPHIALYAKNAWDALALIYHYEPYNEDYRYHPTYLDEHPRILKNVHTNGYYYMPTHYMGE